MTEPLDERTLELPRVTVIYAPAQEIGNDIARWTELLGRSRFHEYLQAIVRNAPDNEWRVNHIRVGAQAMEVTCRPVAGSARVWWWGEVIDDPPHGGARIVELPARSWWRDQSAAPPETKRYLALLVQPAEEVAHRRVLRPYRIGGRWPHPLGGPLVTSGSDPVAD